MTRGVKFLSCSAILVVAACGGESAKLEVRAMATPLAQGKKPVSFRVAEAHSQLALGNVALALEAYRIALREDPKSVDALSGMAVCYEKMGRFDLSRRQYEAALAIEPGNQNVLAMLAATLDQQGLRAEAVAVRAEIAQRMAAAAAPATAAVPAAQSPVEVAAAPPIASPAPAVVQTAPAPAKVAVAEMIGRTIPKPADMPIPVLSAAPIVAGVAIAAPIAVVAAFAPEEPPAPAPVAARKPEAVALAAADAAKVGQSVTVTLPAARPAEPTQELAVAMAPPAPLPAKPVEQKLAAAPAPEPVPVPVAPRAIEMAAIALPPPVRRTTTAGPRLERVSMGEVELVTREGPRWASLLVKQEQKSATVRFVPLQQYNMKFASVRLLNAARVAGLAARTRATLFDRGWRGIAIGDANAVRARSVVLYPGHRRTTAMSLARQFGFATAERASGREITVLLGRDVARLPRMSAGD